MNDSGTETLSTIERGFAVIEWIYDHDGGRVGEVADGLGMSSSTVHRYLYSLERGGYLTKEEGVYHPGLKFLAFGERARTRNEIYTNAGDYTTRLADESGCRSNFMVEEGGEGIYLYTSSGAHGMWTKSTIGKRVPLHVVAAGKAILAFSSDARVREVIEKHGLEHRTDRSITSETELFDELDRTRERGYALNEEEQIPGVNAVGAPVRRSDGGVIGAFSVSVPANQLRDDWRRDELSEIILGTASEFELQLRLS